MSDFTASQRCHQLIGNLHALFNAVSQLDTLAAKVAGGVAVVIDIDTTRSLCEGTISSLQAHHEPRLDGRLREVEGGLEDVASVICGWRTDKPGHLIQACLKLLDLMKLVEYIEREIQENDEEEANAIS